MGLIHQSAAHIVAKMNKYAMAEISPTLVFKPRASIFWTAVRFTILTSALIGMLVPFAMIASHAAGLEGSTHTEASAFTAIFPAVLGLAFWTALWGIPALKCLQELTRRRTIEISEGAISISDDTILGRRCKTERLADYAGLVRHLRTTPMGSRHELFLVHAHSTRNLLLKSCDEVTLLDAEQKAAWLGKPMLPASLLYRLPSRIRRIFQFIRFGTPRVGAVRA